MDSVKNEMKAFQTEVKGSSYLAHLLDLAEDAPDPKFLLSIGGVPTIPMGELIGIKGKAKQGKSQLEYVIVATLLAGVQNGCIKPMQPIKKILLFDTEQGKASLKKCVIRALKFAGLPTDKNEPRFMPFFLRPVPFDQRRIIIEDAIMKEHPEIIFIDGIRDLMEDFNDLRESNELIQWLLYLTTEYGCTVVNVLHQNKAKDDGNMRGHLGTELLNKLCDCYEVSRKDGRFVVSCTDSRNVPCPDFAFSINAEGDFSIDDNTASADKDAARVADIIRVLKLCFEKSDSYGHNDLVRAYALEAALSESTAKRHIAEAKRNGLLQVGSNEKYTMTPQEG